MAVRLPGLCAGGPEEDGRDAVDEILHHLLVHRVAGETVVLERREAALVPALVGLDGVSVGDLPALRLHQLKDFHLLLRREPNVVPIAAGENLDTAQEQIDVQHAGRYVLAPPADFVLDDLSAVA